MTICIAGKNQIAIDAVEFIISLNERYEIIACVNKTDVGENAWQPSFRRYCNKKGIKIVSLAECYQIEELVFFSLEYDVLINPDKFLSKKIFNIHFSLLPSYKGMYTSVFPLLFGEENSGVTLHFIDKGIDTGSIIEQILIPIEINETAFSLYLKYLKFGTYLFQRKFQSIIKDDFTSNKQSIYGSSYFSKSSIDFTSINIDLKKTAWEIHNNFRAFTFRYYQLPKFNGDTICRSRLIPNISDYKAGSIYRQDKYCYILNAIDYQVELWIDMLSTLLTSAENGDLNKLIELDVLGYDLLEKNDKGWNVLIVACYFEQKHIIEYLLEKNADVNTSNFKGTTILMYAMTAASSSGRLDILELLINKGANVYAKDESNYTVFDYAIKRDAQKMIDFFKPFFN
ncbi:MAG: ankyrin repeat domain-containing protein [Bacteroidetes bacterium]|nr:ankyrin repeat domain-containing protein [Bacteroidota bacterium]